MKKLMKKSLAVLLAVLLTMSLSSVAFAADGTGALMQSYSAVSTEDFHSEEYEGKIGKIIFLDLSVSSFPENVTYMGELDLSASAETGTVTAKLALSDNITGINNLDMYIGAKGGVIAPDDCSYLFADTGVQTLEGTENFDTSGVTSMKEMFRGCNFTEFDLDTLDVSNVNDMSYMFKDCLLLKSIKSENSDTGNVAKFNNMLDGCAALNDLSLKNIDLSHTSNIDYMFYGCSSLEVIDLSSWKNTSSIVSINAFRSCPALTTIKLNGWDLSSVATLDGVFAYCDSLQELYLYGVRDAASCTSSVENPVKGVTELTVHTDDINFTDYVLWSECFGKATDVKVKYSVADGAEVVAVSFQKNDAIDYYIVTVNGDEKYVYGGATMNLAAGTQITVNIQPAEQASPLKLNVNGVATEFGTTMNVNEDTTITIQTYHDDTALPPDETVNALTRVIYAVRDFMQKVLDILQGFFGRFMPWLDEAE
ncbi:MAG: BspA family leucine-rich repeat surface protein [Clostridia bacterium]|nr:BspA family leucine-rich repeat surface protein [Clostridia bacterium]